LFVADWRFITPSFRPTVAAFFLGLILALGLLAGETLADPVTIRLDGGRIFNGTIDPRTSAEQLWLRYERGSMVLVQGFAWDTIRDVRVGQETMPGSTLQQNVGRYIKLQPLPPPAEPIRAGILPEGSAAIEAVRAAPPIGEPPRVRSLQIEAAVANWDSDVEVDGLVLRVYPLDGVGDVTPVSGTLEIELVGEGPAAGTQSQTFPILGRWVRQISPADFGSGATMQLPFQGWHPEFDLQLGAYGLVRAKLVVPGQGTFAAATNTLTIRPINALRDRWQQSKLNTRFFPGERTGRGPGP
jgi:hypothetical protein